MLWSRKKKPDDAASEATADTASDSPVENDSEGRETPPEITAPEVTDQQGSESEPAASKDGTPSEDGPDTSSDSLVEDASDGSESSPEGDEPAALQADSSAGDASDGSESSPEGDEPAALQSDSLAEVNQHIAELRQLQIDSLAEVNQSLSKLGQLFEEQIARNQNQSKMFDATYREMKEYKENAILEALHKPIIHYLIGLYDNFRLVESQLNAILNSTEIRPDDLSQFQNNLKNVGWELEEVLFRLDVSPYEERLETLDRKLHKTLATKPADTPEDDRKVAEVHKIGFYWRDKVFRPEEVTVFRYQNKKGEETNG